MRRIRRTYRRLVRCIGPPSFAAAALIFVGFGVHAALDWHHHGAPRAGFFHLHVHFGEHHHEDHHHDHTDSEHHDHHSTDGDQPDPAAPGDRRHAGVLTLATGISQAPAVATTINSPLEPGELLAATSWRRDKRRLINRSTSPRGPPA